MFRVQVCELFAGEEKDGDGNVPMMCSGYRFVSCLLVRRKMEMEMSQ